MDAIDITPAQRKAILALLKRHIPGVPVWAFGSRVKWTSRSESDLDLVAFSVPDQKSRISLLKEAFEESDFPFRVDLLVWDELPETFQKNIRKEHVVFVDKPEAISAMDGKAEAPAGWKIGCLGDLVEIVMGQSPPGETCNSNQTGLPLLNGPTEFGPHHPVPVQFTNDPKKKAVVGDILFCVRGSTTGCMNWADQDYAIGRGIAAIRHNAGKEYQPFLRGLIEYRLPELLAHATGSTFPNVSYDQISKLSCEIPPLPTQRAIAHILGSLDDLIDLNRRANETLEQTARTLFNHYFPYSPEDDLPAGWRVATLPEACEVNPSRPLRKGDVAPYLDMANMPTNSPRALDIYDREFNSGMRFLNDDTLVARITPCLENGKTCFVDFLGKGQIGWGSTEYIVLRPRPPLAPEYAYFLARTDDFRAFAISNMTGTSGRQRVPASCLDHYHVVLPPPKNAHEFGDEVHPIMQAIKAIDEQSRTLSALRDLLLPKLLSGEISAKGNGHMQDYF